MKKLLTIVTVLFLFGCGFALAFNASGEITTSFYFSPGEVVIEDISISKIDPSSTLGGLISSLSLYVEKYIDFVGLRIWRDFSTTSPDFNLMLMPAGTIVGDFVVSEIIFEESEEVILDGRTNTSHSWATFLAVNTALGSDSQNPISIPGTIIFSDGSQVTLTEQDLASGLVTFDTISETGLTFQLLPCSSDPLKCPSIQEVKDGFNIADVNELAHALSVIPGVNNSHILAWINGGTWHFVGNLDLDENFAWDFELTTTDVFSVDSFEKHTLAIVPEGSYDLYAIF